MDIPEDKDEELVTSGDIELFTILQNIIIEFDESDGFARVQ